MDYERFELQIKRAPGGGFVVYVRSPAGESEGRMEPPWEIDRLSRMLRTRAAAQRHLGLPDEPETEIPDERAIGRELFDALFDEPVSTLFYDSLARVGPEGGLRIELRLDLGDPELAEIASLPWEHLYSERLGGHLALRRKTPVVRYVEVPRPARPAPLPDVLRILVMLSSPEGLPPLDLEEERRKIEDSWAGLDGVEVAFLEKPTRERLGAALRDADRAGRPFHALHFMGHGRTVPGTGRGELLFVGDGGAPRPIAGEELARELADFPDLRFVFLNACDTGAPPADGELDPFGGVAAALVRTGVLAVVAMQRPISDRAAIELSRVVYERIAAGDPIDTAVTEGRLALDRLPETAGEWGTPVLFLRQPDGKLFEPRPRRALTRGRLAAIGAALLIAVAVAVWLLPGPRAPDPCREDPPEEAAALVDEGVRSVSNGDPAEGVRPLRRALEIAPGYARAHSTLGFAEMELGHLVEARESFARAVEAQPGCASHRFNLGSFHLAREDYGEAERQLLRALELEPGYTAASAALGRAYRLHDAPERARKVLEDGLRRAAGGDGEPDTTTMASLHANLGRVALALEEPEEAVEHLEQARSLLPAADPRRTEVVTDLAEAHAAAGRTGEACAQLATLPPLGRDPHGTRDRKVVEVADRLHCPEIRR